VEQTKASVSANDPVISTSGGVADPLVPIDGPSRNQPLSIDPAPLNDDSAAVHPVLQNSSSTSPPEKIVHSVESPVLVKDFAEVSQHIGPLPQPNPVPSPFSRAAARKRMTTKNKQPLRLWNLFRMLQWYVYHHTCFRIVVVDSSVVIYYQIHLDFTPFTLIIATARIQVLPL